MTNASMRYQSMASNTYQAVDLHAQIEGANAHELIDLLLKGALVKLAKARGFLQQQKPSEKGQEISKVISILIELQSSLSQQVDSDISSSLHSLYTYITNLIVVGNVENDLSKLDEATQLLTHLRESWNQIPIDQRY